MDKRAISLASDDVLKDMGNVAKWDILVLRAFAESHQSVKETRKKRNCYLFKNCWVEKRSGIDSSTTRKKVQSASEVFPATKVKMRKVNLAWQHINPESKCYALWFVNQQVVVIEKWLCLVRSATLKWSVLSLTSFFQMGKVFKDKLQVHMCAYYTDLCFCSPVLYLL